VSRDQEASTMRRYVLGLLIGLLAGLSLAFAQEATERFIPIGQSPGLSGSHTVIGEIQGGDYEAGRIEVAAGGRVYNVDVTERTRIWIDRSAFKLSALTGKIKDCQRGLKVEVKYEDEQNGGAADWIKVQPTAP
jgi:hypothetical protein